MGIPGRTRITLDGDGDGARRHREFTLTRRSALLLTALILLSWIVVGLLAAQVLTHRDQSAALVELEKQLDEARTEALTARILKAELEQSRRMQEHLLMMLGVARPDAPADSAAVPAGADRFAPVAPVAASPPPSRWPAAGVIIREFTAGDAARGVEEHLGVDIAGEAGSRVVAAAEGEVDFVGEDEILGKYLEIRHGFDYTTIYGHCSWIGVGPGARVRLGEQVAKMGHSGRTATTQLHFEVWKQGEAVDPRKVLAGEPTPR